MSTIKSENELLFVLLSGKVSSGVNRRLNQYFAQAALPLNSDQWGVLHYLWGKDGVTQQELCNSTYKDKPAMTRLIDSLEAQRFVKRTTHKTDRRVNIIKLTAKGAALHAPAQPVVERTMSSIVAGLSPQEVEQAWLLLQRVFTNVKNALDEE